MPQFDFLKTFIAELLDGSGFASLSEQTRQQYAPQFQAEAERRLGLALLPRLNEKSAEELAELVSNPNTKPEDLREFWLANIPDFNALVENTLRSFADEFRQALPV